jgi:hypothetical protein
MTSRQLVDFVENKLKQHGINKLIPSGKMLARTYQLFAASNRLSEAFDEMKEKLEGKMEESTIRLPDDLAAKVAAELEQHRDIPWHRAVRLVVDPDADDQDNDDDDGGELEDDEDLGDVDE